MDRTDEDLILAHCRGDDTAFEELVSRYGRVLLGYLVRMCGDQGSAEDLFQETFKRVYQKAASFKGTGRFRSWLFSIATNAAIDSMRKNAKRVKMVSLNQNKDCDGDNCHAVLADEKTVGPAQSAVLAEQKAQVQRAIEQLPPRQRTALVLAYYQQMSYRQVAEVLGCSVGTVKTHMFRALKALAGLLPDVRGGNL